MMTPITSHEVLHAQINELLHTIGTVSKLIIGVIDVPTVELRYIATVRQCELQIWIGDTMIASQEVTL